MLVASSGPLWLSACRPHIVERGDWMIGTFSLVGEDEVVPGTISRYTLDEDGAFESVNLDSCQNDDEQVTGEYVWKYDESDIVGLFEPNGGDVGGFDEWRLEPTEDCNELLVQFVDGGRVVGESPFYRGIMCMQDLGPCDPGTECDGCKTIWCDGSPPPCEDE